MARKDEGVQSTHWAACWRVHLNCAVARVERLETEIATFHSDEKHGLYDCCGYSEGLACCVNQLQDRLAADPS